MDRSSLPRLRVGVDAPSAVHAVLRGMAKERGNLTLGMKDYLRFVSSETDMTDGAVLWRRFLDWRVEACSSATRVLVGLYWCAWPWRRWALFV